MWPQGWDVLIRPPCQYLPTSFQTPKVSLGGPPQESDEEAIGHQPLVVCLDAGDYSHSPQ